MARTTWILGLVLLSAVGAQAVRILTVRATTGETPFLSANDRSRWCSVAALGGYGQFEIDRFLEIRDPKTKRRSWNTIDLVRHRGWDGKQHYYSSKPPLLSAIYAAVYAAVRMTTSLSLLTETFTTARIILVLVNLLPLAAFWWLWARYWQQQQFSRWTCVIMTCFMVWGTFISTFGNTLNNHVPGAIAAGLSLWTTLQILEAGKRELGWYILAGASAAFCAVCELPSLSWTAAVVALVLPSAPKRAAQGLAIGILPIALAFACVNYWAHGDLRPPYAHRAVGALVVSIPREGSARNLSDDASGIRQAVRAQGYDVSDQSSVEASRTPGVHQLWDETSQYRFALVTAGDQIRIHQWDDWYDYPNSYWYPDRKQGVDRGERSRLAYLFHTTFGHHGIFSLTPMWLLLPIGAFAIWRGAAEDKRLPWQDGRTRIMLAIVAATLVCFAFYIARPLEDRNYGGVNCGFRWMFWFTPLWCWMVAQGIERFRAPWVKAFVILALMVSIYSANAAWHNPWTAPWLTAWFPSSGT